MIIYQKTCHCRIFLDTTVLFNDSFLSEQPAFGSAIYIDSVTMSTSQGACVGQEAFIQSAPACNGWCFTAGSTAPTWLNLLMTRHHTVSYINIETTLGFDSESEFEIGHAMIDQDIVWELEVILYIDLIACKINVYSN